MPQGGKDKIGVMIARQAKVNKLLFVGDRVEYCAASDRWFRYRAGWGTVLKVTEWGITLRPDDPVIADEELWVPDAEWLWFEDGTHAAPAAQHADHNLPRHRAA